jgi:membrane-bound serine protease (ClpP class)
VSKTLQFLLWAVLAFIFVTLIINFAEGLRFFAISASAAGSLGILFIVLAFSSFILEMLTPEFGLFTATGIVSLTIGSILLFQIEPWIIITIDTVLVILSYLFVIRVVKAQKHPVKTGREEIPGQTATVRETLDPKGLVFYGGELWTAVSETGRIEIGEKVTIKQVEGVILHVARK